MSPLWARRRQTLMRLPSTRLPSTSAAGSIGDALVDRLFVLAAFGYFLYRWGASVTMFNTNPPTEDDIRARMLPAHFTVAPDEPAVSHDALKFHFLSDKPTVRYGVRLHSDG